jgi:hypothetical protein
MSTATELAKAEADATEAERPDEDEPDAEPEPQPEPEPEPEQPPQSEPAAMTEQQAEREFAKLEKKAQTYLEGALTIARKLEMPVQPCPLCTFPGLAIPRSANEVTSDVEAAVLALIGKHAEPQYVESDQYERCAACDGWGDVLTGAQKPVSRAAQCNQCGGKGFKPVVQAYVAPPAPTQTAFPGAQLPYVPLPAGSNDAWGRPAGHPHWGLDPAMVGSPNGQKVG